jgi:FtsH-binding integral membrane protein
MKRLFLLVALSLCAVNLHAQSGDRFTMVRSVIAGGAVTASTGGTFSLSGTAGQPSAALLTETRFVVSVGYWITPPLLVFAPKKVGNDFSISFETEAGQSYIVEYTDSLLNPNWQLLPTQNGDGTVKTVTNTAPGVPNRYYRVRQP